MFTAGTGYTNLMEQTSDRVLVSKKLKKRRARQRRVLAGMEDWLIRDAMKGLPADLPLPELVSVRVLVEERLRAHADTQIAEDLSDLLDPMESAYVARNLALFLSATKDAVDVTEGVVFPSDQLLNESYAKGQGSLQQVTTPQFHVIAEVVAVLVWADALAGDYRDPRLPAPA
jgi:hypothetical protein